MTPEAEQLTAHLFRRKYGEILSALCRRLGYRHLELIEEAVMEAFAAAVEQWSFSGTPENPAGWLYIVARNKAVDALRGRRDSSASGMIADERQNPATPAEPERTEDDLLTMIFLCCLPEISEYAQLCLVLKCVSGFSVAEISSALAANPEAVKRTISRAKQTLAERGDLPESADRETVRARFPVVLQVLYSLFNEGYSSSGGGEAGVKLRRDLAEEAIRLTDFLTQSSFLPVEFLPDVHALLALMLIQASRFDARFSADGEPVLLSDQDRTLWDRELISAGLLALQKSSAGVSHPSFYHLEARIAAEHAISDSFDSTDWHKIISLYDQLLSLKDSDLVRLNRATAVFFSGDVQGAEDEMRKTDFRVGLKNSPTGRFQHRVLEAEIHRRRGRVRQAAEAAEEAMALAPAASDRVFCAKLLKKIRSDVPE